MTAFIHLSMNSHFTDQIGFLGIPVNWLGHSCVQVEKQVSPPPPGPFQILTFPASSEYLLSNFYNTSLIANSRGVHSGY